MMFVVLLAIMLPVLGLSGEKLQLGFLPDYSFLRDISAESRIVGGEDAAEGEFPYQVSLRYNGFFKAHFCGGSIISDKVILTAAHCVRKPPLVPFTQVEVVAGLHHMKKDGPNVQTSKILKTIIHPKYAGGISPYDIALHIISKPFKFNKFVQPIALPSPGYEPSGNAVISGWGNISNRSIARLPDVLQKATVKLVEYDKCEKKFSVSPLNQFSNICTGPIDGNLSACSGDSGGPLAQNINGTNTIIGIVSWGMVPCGHGYPSVYTKVSSFVDFIKKYSL